MYLFLNIRYRWCSFSFLKTELEQKIIIGKKMTDSPKYQKQGDREKTEPTEAVIVTW